MFKVLFILFVIKLHALINIYKVLTDFPIFVIVEVLLIAKFNLSIDLFSYSNNGSFFAIREKR